MLVVRLFGLVDIETNSKLVSHQSPQLLTHTQTKKTLEKYFSLLYKLAALIIEKDCV